MKNIALVVSYDGSNYHGWQIQPNALTVQEMIERAIFQITRQRCRLIGAGRTDAGVHALNQVANFKIQVEIELGGFKRSLNAVLPNDIVVKEASEVAPSFHARFSARSKTYRYLILNRADPSPFYSGYVWWIPHALDIEAMRKAASYLIGRQDFTSMKASDCESRGAIREVKEARIDMTEGGLIQFVIEADAFLKHMVRNIVGTLVSVARGELTPKELLDILNARDRSRAGITAPARGLFLERVNYGLDIMRDIP